MTYQPSWGQQPQTPGGTPGGTPAGGGAPYQFQGHGGYPAQQPKTDGMAIAALVCGIVSFFLLALGLIAAIVALILARRSDRKIAESGGTLTGQSLNKVARILAWVNIALTVLAIIVAIVVAVVANNGSSALAVLA